MALAAYLSAVALSGCGEDPAPAIRAGRGPGSYLASLPIQTLGGKVDLGALSPCDGDVSRVVRIVNQTDEPVTILSYSPNCACLSAEIAGSLTLAAKEEREVKVTVHPSGHGSRSTAVEFGGTGGFLGSIRVDWSLDSGVACMPVQVAVGGDERERAIDVDVFGIDGRPIRVLGIEPPVGSVEQGSGPKCRVVLSSFEARRFAESEQGRSHPGAVVAADGRVTALKVAIATDHPTCPMAEFEFSFAQ